VSVQDEGPAPLLRLPTRAALWRVAWPMVALGWLRTLLLLTDAYWVGDLGARELEALAGASFAAWMLDHAGELAATGVHARIAQAEGARWRDRFGGIAVSGLAVSGLVWGVLLATMPWSVPAYVHALGVSPALGVPTAAFLQASVWAAPGLFVLALVGGVMRGLGRTRDALVLTGAGLLVNLVLDPVLIFGWWQAPALGLAGAAWATGIAAGACGLLGVVWLGGDGTLTPSPPTWERMRDVARVGAPIAATGVGFALVYVVLGRMIAGFGGEHLAAIGIGHRVEGVPYLAGVGLAIGASTLVGQHVGAGSPDEARRAVHTAARASDLVMLASGLVGLVFAEPIYGLFTDDPAIVAAGGVYLRWQAIVWIGMGRELVYEGAFTGVGHTLPAMAWGGGLTLARIPLAALLAWGVGLGVQGVWIAVAASTAGKGLALGWRWAAGGWSALGPGEVGTTPHTT